MKSFIEGKVSIAIPAYKSNFLKEAINSVLSQTYTNFELIIVNDNSPEDLDNIVLSFKDSRIRYYKNEINLGKNSIVHNWNKCLSYARGEFFVLLCDDDIMKPEFLRTMINYTIKYPKCNVFKTRCQIIQDNLNNIIEESPIWKEYENEQEYIINKLDGLRKHTISEFLYRTKHVKKTQYIPFPVGYYSDDASILRFCKDKGIVNTKEVLMIFRKSNIHITGNKKYNIQKTRAAILYYNWLFNNYKNETTLFYKKIKDQMNYEFHQYFIDTSNIIKALYILYLIPKTVFTIKEKIAIFLNRYCNNI